MTIAEDNSRRPIDEEASASGDTAMELLSSEENEPFLQILLRQQLRLQENSMRIQEEKYLREINGLRQEMNERMKLFPEPEKQSTALETFYDDSGEGVDGVQLVTASVGEHFSKRPKEAVKTAIKPEIKSWVYDLGEKVEKVSAKSHREQDHDIRNTSNFNSTVKIKNVKRDTGLTVSFGNNEVDQQKALYHIPSEQQNRKNFLAVDEEEFIALKDHRKQHDDKIQRQDDKIQRQDDMIQLLETKIQQIENQGMTREGSMIPRRYSIFRTFTELSPQSDSSSLNDLDYFGHDTFTMMILNKVRSRSWILGTTSFCFEMVLGSMIAINQFKASIGTSIFNVPFKVDTEVRIVQFLSIILCLSIQSDVLTSIKSFIILGQGSNWRQVIGVGEHNSAIASCGLWTLRIGIPNTMKLVQGLTVTLVSFVIIVQADTIIDLLKDFTALMIVSETDNILYQLAISGYLGEQLCQEALQIEQKAESASRMDANERQQGKNNGLVYVRLVFLFLLGAMFGGWGVIFQNQINGVYFEEKFPGCVNYELALTHFGDGVCYGGTLNTIECKFEDGDCINHNTAFPNCKGKGLEGLVNVENELGKGECNMDFAISECDYDGGLCCPYDIHRSPIFRDGQCHSGIISSIGCDRDGGDCLDFINAYPDCSIENGANGTAPGNGICEGGGYTTEECGYEDGDCDVGQIGGDMIFTGIFSPFDARIYFDMKMSGDGSTVLIELRHTTQFGKFDIFAPSRVLGYRYSKDERWVEQPSLEGDKVFDGQDTEMAVDLWPSSWTVNAGGNLVAIGVPWNDKVDVFDFLGTIGSTLRHTFIGSEESFNYGSQVDMTDDGSRIVVSSYNNYYYSGMVQVFQLDQLEQVWAQVGDSILGNTFRERIGSKNLRINSLDGTRVFFDAFKPYSDDPVVIRAYELILNSNQWVRLGGSISSNANDIALFDGSTNKLVVSADGSRVVQSSFSTMTTRPGEVNIFDLITDPVSNERKWSQLGPPILRMFSDGEFNGSAGDGFGRDISMSADGHFLVVSSVKTSCDGVNLREAEIIKQQTREDDDNDEFFSDIDALLTNRGLCFTGSVQMYQYKPTNPPHRPFTLLPYRRDEYLNSVLEEAEQERDNTLLGLHVSLSRDGSKFAVSGLDLTNMSGFAKVFNVVDLFYIDCMVEKPNTIGDGDCRDAFEPYYTEQCGYDGGDCPLPSSPDGFDDCKVFAPIRIGDDSCDSLLPNNSELCGYDGGDCPLPAPVDGYPNCFVTYPEFIGDGYCHYLLPYDSYECGFDGGDCLPPEYAPTSSPSKSNQPSQSPSITSSPTESTQPSHDPSSEASSEPSLTHAPSQSIFPSNHPSKSAMPTTVNIAVNLELRTDEYPAETTWFLLDESNNGTLIATGPDDDETYDEQMLYNFTFILNRCDSYIFQIFDSYGDGFSPSGYAALTAEGGRGNETVGTIEGNFGLEGRIDVYICGDED